MKIPEYRPLTLIEWNRYLKYIEHFIHKFFHFFTFFHLLSDLLSYFLLFLHFSYHWLLLLISTIFTRGKFKFYIQIFFAIFAVRVFNLSIRSNYYCFAKGNIILFLFLFFSFYFFLFNSFLVEISFWWTDFNYYQYSDYFNYFVFFCLNLRNCSKN